MSTSTEDFFNELGDQYDQVIRRCVPQYAEMLESMMDYLPPKLLTRIARDQASVPALRILELGSGSGNLSSIILDRFPESKLTVVDSSEKLIAVVKSRFGKRIHHYQKTLFQDLDFKDNSFDLIISSISIHHLNDDEKLQLFKNSRQWLTPNSPLAFCDQFRGETDAIYQKHLKNWKTSSFELGSNEAEWEAWMEHQEAHDFHSTIRTHFDLLEKAGFQSIDCTRRYLLWTTMIAM